ncbi:hypothetical protein KUM42_14745 [Modestobacter sp. L9-4]|uniref:hypothetical protein n=1 Tax=Modestobacter sp. L9-4 TaxID=2851567 RepID=UPI001C76BDD1|nr:hypothetical protein [Modestobacter sp. L9-4]QXG75091.1 hypothetical protein KUM42_14745 [Modestobacter sp. L9-4]
MAREIPEAVRAAAGLAATVLDEARKLPETLPGLPVRLIGLALQSSLKLQQQYSGLVARGDELLDGLVGGSDGGLATFDDDDEDDLPARPAGAGGLRTSAFDLVEEPDEELLADDAVTVAEDVPAPDVAVEALLAESPADAAELDAEELADADLVDEQLVAEELADELADADPETVSLDDPPAEVSAEALIEAIAEDDADLSPAEIASLPADPEADAITAVVDELAGEVADEVAVEVPEAVPAEVLEDLTADAVTGLAEDEESIEEAVAEELIAEPVVAGTPPEDTPAPSDTSSDADETVAGVPALDPAAGEVPAVSAVDTPVDTVDDGSQGGDVLTTADGADEAVEQPADEPAPLSPVDGYDSFSIPALRGHLRAYPAETVADLLDYERATQARAPYVTLLQNRLEKLSADRG